MFPLTLHHITCKKTVFNAVAAQGFTLKDHTQSYFIITARSVLFGQFWKIWSPSFVFINPAGLSLDSGDVNHSVSFSCAQPYHITFGTSLMLNLSPICCIQKPSVPKVETDLMLKLPSTWAGTGLTLKLESTFYLQSSVTIVGTRLTRQLTNITYHSWDKSNAKFIIINMLYPKLGLFRFNVFIGFLCDVEEQKIDFHNVLIAVFHHVMSSLKLKVLQCQWYLMLCSVWASVFVFFFRFFPFIFSICKFL